MEEEEETFPELEEWFQKQPALINWLRKKRAEAQRQYQELHVEYLREASRNMARFKAQSYLHKSVLEPPDNFSKGNLPVAVMLRANGVGLDNNYTFAMELKGELIRWNKWHSWVLTPQTSEASYPKPTPYDPFDPPRPDVRRRRLAKQ